MSREEEDKFKGAFSPWLLPFLASLYSNSSIYSEYLMPDVWLSDVFPVYESRGETRDPKIDDGNLHCWFEFRIKGVES